MTHQSLDQIDEAIYPVLLSRATTNSYLSGMPSLQNTYVKRPLRTNSYEHLLSHLALFKSLMMREVEGSFDKHTRKESFFAVLKMFSFDFELKKNFKFFNFLTGFTNNLSKVHNLLAKNMTSLRSNFFFCYTVRKFKLTEILGDSTFQRLLNSKSLNMQYTQRLNQKCIYRDL